MRGSTLGGQQSQDYGILYLIFESQILLPKIIFQKTEEIYIFVIVHDENLG